jgi:acyl-CoA synthetase (AMP-forming)/AMP-acid ligase II
VNALAGRIAAASAGRHVLAVSDGRTGLTGVELAEAASEAARRVVAASRRGSPVVAVSLPLSVDLVTHLVAAVTGGFCVCVLDPSASADHRAAVVASLAPDVVVDAEGVRAVTPTTATPSPVPDDRTTAGYIAMSSGSTGGGPKAVLSSWDSVGQFVADGAQALELDSGSVWAEASHLAYDMAITNALVALACGATLQVSPSLGDRLRPLRFTDRVGATHLRVAPRFVDLAVAEQRRAPEGLRVWASGGDRLQAGQVEALLGLGVPTVVNTYGTSETIGFASIARFTGSAPVPSHRGVAPIGTGRVGGWSVELAPSVEVAGPAPSVEVAEPGPQPAPARDAAPPARGDDVVPELLAIRSAHLPGGLLFGSSAGEYPAWRDGHVITGDLGVQVDGSFFCLGRSGRRVKRHGLFVNLDDVDAQVRDHTGMPSFTVLTAEGRLVTLVESTDGVDAIRGSLSSVLSPDLLPDLVVGVRQVPRLANGKVDLVAAAAAAAAAESG